MRTAEVTKNDSLVYVFGCCVFYRGGDDGDSLTGEEFCVKNLLIIYLFCRVEERLPAMTRNSSGDEIANVNFLYDDIVHALKIQICYTNRNIIMNFVGNDGESEP